VLRAVRRRRVDLDRLESGKGHGLARAAPDPKGGGGRTGDRVRRGTAGRHDHRLRRHARRCSLGETRCRTHIQARLWIPSLGTWCGTTGEPLGAMLRPGNAGSNDVDDHLELLDQAIGSLPQVPTTARRCPLARPISATGSGHRWLRTVARSDAGRGRPSASVTGPETRGRTSCATARGRHLRTAASRSHHSP